MYDRYAYLVEVLREFEYNDHRIGELCPFFVQSVIFNTMLYTSNRCLKKIGVELGEDTDEIDEWLSALGDGIHSKFWNEKHHIYLDYDVRLDQIIVKKTLAGFLPLFGKLVEPDRADRLIDTLLYSGEYWSEDGYPFSTVSWLEPEFNPVNYWRGPIWINMNWFLIRGFLNYGHVDKAKELIDRTLELVSEKGFYECFHPKTGEGLGSNSFSWTASLTIDLIETYQSLLLT
jgi:glycogen debranching enzyme